MIAFITSIGEPTTELCKWALERNGFDVTVMQNPSTLARKLAAIYKTYHSDFVRIDADVIVNKRFTPQLLNRLAQTDDIWWWQFTTFDWLKLDKNHSISYIKAEAIPALRDNADRFLRSLRPETEISRIPEFHNPRRFKSYEFELMGLHGYRNDLERAKKLKKRRKQLDLYDFEMAERLEAL